MKRIIFIIFTIFSLTVFAQSEDFPKNILQDANADFSVRTSVDIFEVRKILSEFHNQYLQNLQDKEENFPLAQGGFSAVQGNASSAQGFSLEEDLRKLAATGQNKEIKAKAQYHLALLLFRKQEDNGNEIKKLLQSAISLTKGDEQNRTVYFNAHLFLGSFLLAHQDSIESEKVYKNILPPIFSPILYSSDILLPYLGLGDSLFAQYRYKEAFDIYSQGFPLIAKIPLTAAMETEHNDFLGFFRVRLIWSLIRSGEYQLGLEHLEKFSRESYLYEHFLTQPLVKNIIESGAIALYELQDKERYQHFSQLRCKNDLCKKMVWGAFDLLNDAGRGDEVEDIAHKIQNFFLHSPQLLYFIKARLRAIDKDKFPEKYHQFCFASILLIENNSLWKTQVVLDKQDEALRKTLLETMATQSYSYFYSLGIQSGVTSYFEKSKQILRARLNDYLENENRGKLLLQAALSAWRAHDLHSAWEFVTLCKKSYEDRDTLTEAFLLAIALGREFSQGSLSRQEKNYQAYENAVDEYFNAFPEDSEARNAFFESAKRAEYLGDVIEAKRRFTQLLDVVTKDKEDSLLHRMDIEKVALSLNQVLQKIPFVENTPQTLGNLQKLVESEELSQETLAKISQSSADAAKIYAQNLREQGKGRDAAFYLSFWARENARNALAPELMLEAITGFALLQMWDQVFEKAQSFEDIFSSSNDYQKALFWRARAQYERLLFRAAAVDFSRALSFTESLLSPQERRFALDKVTLISGKSAPGAQAFGEHKKREDEQLFAEISKLDVENATDIVQLESLLQKLLHFYKEKRSVSEQERLQCVVFVVQTMHLLAQDYRKLSKNNNDKYLLKSSYYQEEKKRFFYKEVDIAKLTKENKIFIARKLSVLFPIKTDIIVYPDVKEENVLDRLYIKSLFDKREGIVQQALNEFFAEKYFNALEIIKDLIKNKIYQKHKTFVENFEADNFKELLFLLALCYYKIGDKISALDTLERIVTASEKWVPVYLALADFYIQEKQYAFAELVANKGIDKGTKPELKLFILKSRSLWEQGKTVEAKRLLSEASFLFPEDLSLSNEIARRAYSEGDYSGACQRFFKDFEQQSDNKVYLHNQVSCLIRRQDWDKADELLQKAIAKGAIYQEDFYYLKGIMKKTQGDMKGALEAWTTYLKLNDGNIEREKWVFAALNDINITLKFQLTKR